MATPRTTSIKGPGKRGHIVAHDVSLRAQTGTHVSEQNQKQFLSATNVALPGKRGNIVSATMCPRLPGP